MWKRILLSVMLLALLLKIGTISSQSMAKTAAAENMKRMMAFREKHGTVIEMDSERFKKYVKAKNSKYSVVAMFTALKSSFKCAVCPEAKKEFEILASSHEALYPSSNLFFVQIDFHNSQEAFQAMKLQHVPAFYYFPENRKRKKSDTFDARKMGYKAKGLARWLAEVADVKTKIITPTDYTQLFAVGAALSPFLILALWKPDFLIKFLSNKIIWGLLVLCAVLVMTSGQMWNHIRKPSNANRKANGGVEYIHGSRSGQYIFESYIVMGINGAIALGFILLNELHSFKSRFTKKAFGFLGLGMVVVFFGLLISIFRFKNRGYPYSLLFL